MPIIVQSRRVIDGLLIAVNAQYQIKDQIVDNFAQRSAAGRSDLKRDVIPRPQVDSYQRPDH